MFSYRLVSTKIDTRVSSNSASSSPSMDVWLMVTLVVFRSGGRDSTGAGVVRRSASSPPDLQPRAGAGAASRSRQRRAGVILGV